MTCSLAFNIWKLYMRRFFFRKLNIALISIQCMLLPFVMVADSFGSVARSTVPHVLFIFWQLVRFRKCIRCLGSHLSYNFSFTKNILIWANIKLKAKEKVLFFSWYHIIVLFLHFVLILLYSVVNGYKYAFWVSV